MRVQTRKKNEWLLLRDNQMISSEREYTIRRIRKIEVERTVELARICERNILLLPMSLKFDGTEQWNILIVENKLGSSFIDEILFLFLVLSEDSGKFQHLFSTIDLQSIVCLLALLYHGV